MIVLIRLGVHDHGMVDAGLADKIHVSFQRLRGRPVGGGGVVREAPLVVRKKMHVAVDQDARGTRPPESGSGGQGQAFTAR